MFVIHGKHSEDKSILQNENIENELLVNKFAV